MDFQATKSVKLLVVTSASAKEADEMLNGLIPEWGSISYGNKLEFLRNNFNFSLVHRYTESTNSDDIDREDYFSILQYIVSEARDFGTDAVIRK